MAFPMVSSLGKAPSKKFLGEFFASVFNNTQNNGDIATALQLNEEDTQTVCL